MSVSEKRAGLYPVIRRARRPLIIQEDDAVATPAVVTEPQPVGPLVAAEGAEAPEPVSYLKAPARKADVGPFSDELEIDI